MKNKKQSIFLSSFKGQVYIIVGLLCAVFLLLLLNNYADNFVKETEKQHGDKLEMEASFLHLVSIERTGLGTEKDFSSLEKKYKQLNSSCLTCHREEPLFLMERVEALRSLYNVFGEAAILHKLVQNRLEILIDSVRYIHEHHVASLKNFSRRNQAQETVQPISKQFQKSDTRSASELDIIQQVVVIQQLLSDIRAKFHLLREEPGISQLKKELRKDLSSFYKAVNTFEDFSLDAQDGLLVEDLLENGRLFERSFDTLANLMGKQSEYVNRLEKNLVQIVDDFRDTRKKLLDLRDKLYQRLKMLRVGIFLLVLSLFITSFLKSRRIIQSITGIVSETEKIEKDFTYRIKDNPTIINEFQVLTHSLNSMAGKIETRVRNLSDEIHQRTLAEEKLNTEKERLAVTLKSIGDGVITADTAGRVTLLNKVAEQLTGWSQEEALGQQVNKVFNTVDEQSGKPHDNPVKTIIRQGRVVELGDKMVLISKQGTTRSISDSGAPIRDVENKIIGVVIVFRDVTDQLQMETELLKMMKLESLGVLAGGIAHDFNNILLAILGNINLSRKHIEQDNRAFELLNEAEKAATRARGLTQQLLTFSRGGDPVRKAASIKRLIIDSAGFALRGSPIDCEYQFDEDLWLVDVDEDQMSQVIQNVTLNARHAMQNGGKIIIKCRNISDTKTEQGFTLPEKEYVKITLSDTGKGIEPGDLKKIFDPYFTTKDEGSGLGLAISHSIVSKHNGQITIDSEVGTGTTVTIYLPAVPGASEQNDMKPDMKTDCSGKVMVMDDEKMVQRICADMIRHLGYDVILADDGQQAIDKYKELMNTDNPIDIIIMDLTIRGGMGGKEAARKILELDKDAKLVVASGYSNDPILAEYTQYGFRGALVKPFDLNAISEELSRLTSG